VDVVKVEATDAETEETEEIVSDETVAVG